LLYFTVLKEELLKRILSSGFKLGWFIAMVLYKARTHKFQIASQPYWTSVSDVDMKFCKSARVTYPPSSSVMFMYSYCYIYVFLLCMCCRVYPTFIVPIDILRLPWLRFFHAFSSVVRQMPGYNPQRQGTAHIVLNCVLFVCE
jgi:hypothetical protein